MMPLVTFVVPCYRFGHLLAKCINSILAQTYQDFEVLIMDNCSPDDTPEVAKSFHDSRVKYIRNEENIGHIRNFNKGIAMAGGKYVWLVAADDWLRSPKVLGRYIDLMETNPQVGYTFCRAIESLGEGERGIVSWADCGEEDCVWDGAEFLRRFLVHSNCIVMSSVMARKDCYEAISFFPLDLSYAGDWHQWCVFALRNCVAYFAEPMVCFRVHEESLSSSFMRSNKQMIRNELIDVLWRVRDNAAAAGMSDVRAQCTEEIATRYLQLADEQYTCGELEEASHNYWRALVLRPWWGKTCTKYILGRTGRVGRRIRRFLSERSAKN